MDSKERWEYDVFEVSPILNRDFGLVLFRHCGGVERLERLRRVAEHALQSVPHLLLKAAKWRECSTAVPRFVDDEGHHLRT